MCGRLKARKVRVGRSLARGLSAQASIALRICQIPRRLVLHQSPKVVTGQSASTTVLLYRIHLLSSSSTADTCNMEHPFESLACHLLTRSLRLGGERPEEAMVVLMHRQRGPTVTNPFPFYSSQRLRPPQNRLPLGQLPGLLLLLLMLQKKRNIGLLRLLPPPRHFAVALLYLLLCLPPVGSPNACRSASSATRNEGPRHRSRV